MSTLTKTNHKALNSSSPRIHNIKQAIASYENITRNELRVKLEMIFSGNCFSDSEVEELLVYTNALYNTTLCREEFYCFKSYATSRAVIEKESNGISCTTAFVAGCVTACVADQLIYGVNADSVILAGTYSTMALIGNDILDYRDRSTEEKVGYFAAGAAITGLTSLVCHQMEQEQKEQRNQ